MTFFPPFPFGSFSCHRFFLNVCLILVYLCLFKSKTEKKAACEFSVFGPLLGKWARGWPVHLGVLKCQNVEVWHCNVNFYTGWPSVFSVYSLLHFFGEIFLLFPGGRGWGSVVNIWLPDNLYTSKMGFDFSI